MLLCIFLQEIRMLENSSYLLTHLFIYLLTYLIT